MEEKHSIGAEIIYHFEVEHHRIPLAQFIDTAEATRDILDNFNDQFFGGGLKYDLNIVPSEKGSLIEAIQFIINSESADFIRLILDNDYFKSFIAGLTGYKLANLPEALGEKIRKIFKNNNGVKKQSVISDKIDTLSKEEQEKLIVLLLIRFLSEDIDKLSDNNITLDNFLKAFKAKNKFYNGCIDNEEVQGIAFDRTDIFSIKRKDFKKQIVDIPNESLQWFSEITDIVVTSPNWKRKGRRWQALNSNDPLIQFTIEDNEFWQRVEYSSIITSTRDQMEVQWIYQTDDKGTKFRVLKVLSYNGEEISEPLSEGEIQARCARENIVSNPKKDNKPSNEQPDLFSIPPNKPPPPE